MWKIMKSAVTVDSTDKIVEEIVAISDGSGASKVSKSVDDTAEEISTISAGSVIKHNPSVEDVGMVHLRRWLLNQEMVKSRLRKSV
ncbi:hypothetical protein QJS10_CPB18g02050 [Acorus calamus]|uniref:Uncharacterized protein n=1 Tax=Acorus calamus TaxID=4465 RepID=A0AAV9CQ64_ACOCL|nr:hypothetical protein QJS10_CPB18g02050 [Acorus calamus]